MATGKATLSRKHRGEGHSGQGHGESGRISVKWFLLPAALGFVLYLNTLGHQWCLDDYGLIVDNWVTKKGWEGIPIHLIHDYRYGYWNHGGDLYRPLSPMMFAAEWAMFGDTPFFGHLINVLIYSLVCFLFGYTLYRWTKGPVFSMLAALLFAAHPVHTEVVANVKSRDELLSALFVLLTWLLWQREQHHRPRILYLAGATVSFGLALLAKESALTFLPLLPLSVLFFRHKPKPKDYAVTLVFLLPTALFLFARSVVLGDVVGADSVSILDNVLAGADSTSAALAGAIRHIGEYLRMLLLPWPLVSDKGWNQIPLEGFSSIGVWISLLVILLGFAAVAVIWKAHRRLVFGLLWFVFTFSLAANILVLIGTSYGERLLFLPSAGFAMVVAALFRWGHSGEYPGWPEWLNRPVGKAFIGLIVVFSVLTVMRNPAWYDSRTLYAADIRHSPNSVKLRYHHALETGKAASELPAGPDRERMLREALVDLDKVTAAHPTYWEAFGTAGLYAYRLGDRERAMRNYERATSLNPNAAIAWSNMGILYAEQGDLAKAREVYEKAVIADPRFTDAWMNLGAIKAQQGRFDEAISAFEQGLAYDPENGRLLFMLGSAYRDSGRPEQGKPYLDKAARLGVR